MARFRVKLEAIFSIKAKNLNYAYQQVEDLLNEWASYKGLSFVDINKSIEKEEIE